MNLKPGTIVDKLGQLNAEISDLQKKKLLLRGELINAAGNGPVEGKLFRATINHSEISRINYKGLIEKLAPPKRVITKFTKTVEQTNVRVVSR